AALGEPVQSACLRFTCGCATPFVGRCAPSAGGRRTGLGCWWSSGHPVPFARWARCWGGAEWPSHFFFFFFFFFFYTHTSKLYFFKILFIRLDPTYFPLRSK